MGLKRIMFMAEVTFPADDPRSLEQLATDTGAGMVTGMDSVGASVARLAYQGAAEDPDPEPVAEDVPPVDNPTDPEDQSDD